MPTPKANPLATRPVWDDTTRAEMANVVAETAARAAAEVVRHFGIDPDSHKDEHDAIKSMVPWFDAQVAKESARKKFWDSLLEQNKKHVINAAIWFIILATIMGATGAWSYLWDRLFK